MLQLLLGFRRRLGFLPDKPPLYDEMTVRDYLEGRWLPARETTIAASTGRAHWNVTRSPGPRRKDRKGVV